MTATPTSPAPPAAAAVRSASGTPGSRQGLARDSLLTILTRFGLAALILATDVVLARLLGPSAKGRFTLVLLLSQLAAVVASWGMDAALGVVAGRSREDARRGFGNAVLWTLAVGGLAVVLACWLYGLPTDVRPTGPLARVIPNLSAAQFLYGALAIPGELFFAIGLFALLGRRHVAAYNAIRLLRRATLLALVVAAAAVARLSLDVAVVCNLVALATTVTAIVLAAARDGTASLEGSRSLLAEELRFGTRVLPGAIAERLQLRSDAFLLNALVGVRATGVYSVTAGLAETLWYIPNALGTVMFSRAVDPAEDASGTAVVLSRATIAITLALAVPTFAFGPWFVELLYGSAFAEAGVALRWILPGIVAYSVVAVLSRYLVGRGRPGLATGAMLTGLAVNVVSNVVLIPALGIIGAAMSSSLSYWITAILILAAFHRLSGRGLGETLILRPRDVVAASRALRRPRAVPVGAPATVPGLQGATRVRLDEGDEAAEPGPGGEP
ncbi:MAG TPA: polysaccharide biosynthesis C-terminal domain-containing protein [Candidatus Limnocylindrales bacterium]|jgi:O-antigen/teichoic acid export membrane protein